MERFINFEQTRMVLVSSMSPVLAFYTPTKGFVIALVIMFAFNIWAGMRADGVSIIRCKNFSFSKFKTSLVELILYLVIAEVVFTIMVQCGDSKAAIYATKSVTYVFMYVYLQNSFKNLTIAYPKNISIRVIYHVIRFEFTRAMPSHVQAIIQRLDKEFDKANKK